MATFKCNQQRKQRAGGLTNRPGGAAPGPPPGTAPIRDGQPAQHLPRQKEPGRKLLNTKGCRKESSGSADTLTHAGIG